MIVYKMHSPCEEEVAFKTTYNAADKWINKTETEMQNTLTNIMHHMLKPDSNAPFAKGGNVEKAIKEFPG